jgi:hypothetical protein
MKAISEFAIQITRRGRFPAFELRAFQQLRATSDEIRAALGEVALFSGRSLPERLAVSDSLIRLAKALERFNADRSFVLDGLSRRRRKS